MKQKELNLISDYEPSGIMYADGGFRRGFIWRLGTFSLVIIQMKIGILQVLYLSDDI